MAPSSNHGLVRHYFSYSLAQQYKCMANKNSQIFVHLSGLCMYSVHHQCNKHYGWIIPVFWCIVVCGRKISYHDTYFSILVYQLDWLGSDFLYGLSIPNFWFELKIADVFVIVLNTKGKTEIMILWLLKELPKAKHVVYANTCILNTEFEVGPVAVVNMPPCRLTWTLKTFFFVKPGL